MFFSTLPTVAEGFQLKTWRGGPEAGKPKVPPVARSLVDRGLMRLDTSQRLPRLFFTEAGLVELRAMVADRRLDRSETIRPCPPGAWHRPGVGDGSAAGVTGAGPLVMARSYPLRSAGSRSARATPWTRRT